MVELAWKALPRMLPGAVIGDRASAGEVMERQGEPEEPEPHKGDQVESRRIVRDRRSRPAATSRAATHGAAAVRRLISSTIRYLIYVVFCLVMNGLLIAFALTIHGEQANDAAVLLVVLVAVVCWLGITYGFGVAIKTVGTPRERR